MGEGEEVRWFPSMLICWRSNLIRIYSKGGRLVGGCLFTWSLLYRFCRKAGSQENGLLLRFSFQGRKKSFILPCPVELHVSHEFLRSTQILLNSQWVRQAATPVIPSSSLLDQDKTPRLYNTVLRLRFLH